MTDLATLRPADREGMAPFADGFTWYRITGRLSRDRRPLVVLHGGPGCTHDYLLRLAALADAGLGGRAVVHYDQIGNGRSSHHPDRAPEHWTPQLFLDELDNLLAHLGIAEDYDLLGQSWGGMLAAEHAVRRPAGLRHLVISNSPASMASWLDAAAGLRAQLPPEVDDVLRAHEAAGTTDSPEYLAAMQVFYDRHVCRVVPNPPEVVAAFAWIERDPTVYHAMNGPSEFHVVGSIRDWSIVDRLTAVAAPTLVLSGAHDEATPETVRPYVERIPHARQHVFPESSHMPMVEETAAYLEVVRAFLDDDERGRS
jgi:L-proline amide hydrolase